MKEVNIEIENIKLANMGVDQPLRYQPFRFNENQFVGYWISTDPETNVDVIVFYVSSQTFNCKYCKKNIDLFESILNK